MISFRGMNQDRFQRRVAEILHPQSGVRRDTDRICLIVEAYLEYIIGVEHIQTFEVSDEIRDTISEFLSSNIK